MILKVQLLALLFSFIYGIFFYFLVLLNYKFLYKNKYSIIIDLLFIMDNVLLYFIILRKINNGVTHPYLFIVLIIGYLLTNYVDKKIRKWYNSIIGDD